jgi:CubicO group peptidase (beta-lactamase class C family)
MVMERALKLVIFSVVLAALAGCGGKHPDPYRYGVPELAADGWSVGDADEAGMRTEILSDMMDYVMDTEGHNIHSILIFRDDKLVFEEYFEGYLYSSNPPGSNGDYITYDRETDHYLASVSKTVTSVIFGIAVKEGFITDLDEKVVDIFPQYSDVLTGEKADITVRHLLTMSSGLSWDESTTPYGDPSNDVTRLFLSDDPLKEILSNTLLTPPGQTFLYNSGGTNVLGAIIEKYTGMSLLEFGNRYLFDPLNVSGGIWQRMGGGLYFASGGVFLRPRELAKIGFLFINDGYWKEKQIVSEEWIDDSATGHILTLGRTLPSAHAYGYQWWIMDFHAGNKTWPCFFAAGWGDQYMFIFPGQEMIVVFNGGNYLRSGSVFPFDLVEDYILRAVEK